ncbi:MAG TPA: hypothetical protein VFZ23_13380 [Pyrinomonadaceae bacterium]
MKKFIQVSLFSLLALFAVVSVNADSGSGTEVEIPFAFNVGDRSYEAGSYIVKVERLPAGGGILSIQDTRTDDVQLVLMAYSGETRGSDFKLVFDSIEGRRYLTKVRKSERTYALARPKVSRDAA